ASVFGTGPATLTEPSETRGARCANATAGAPRPSTKQAVTIESEERRTITHLRIRAQRPSTSRRRDPRPRTPDPQPTYHARGPRSSGAALAGRAALALGSPGAL